MQWQVQMIPESLLNDHQNLQTGIGWPSIKTNGRQDGVSSPRSRAANHLIIVNSLSLEVERQNRAGRAITGVSRCGIGARTRLVSNQVTMNSQLIGTETRARFLQVRQAGRSSIPPRHSGGKGA